MAVKRTEMQLIIDGSAIAEIYTVPASSSPAWCGKEIGHADLHSAGVPSEADRPLCELEAESVAFIVCEQLGVDSSDYSFGYLANWAGNDTERAAKLLHELGGRVAGAAKRIIEALEPAAIEEAVAA